MYRRILLPTDGSKLSLATIKAGIDLARTLRASVVGLYVGPVYQIPYYYVEYLPTQYVSPAQHEKLVKKTAIKYLSAIENAAKAAGVPCETYTEFSSYPEDKIVEVAQKKKCDLIFIGSHGRGGIGRFFIGSVTVRVLSACTIPVLVFRQGKVKPKRKTRQQDDFPELLKAKGKAPVIEEEYSQAVS